MFSSAVTFVDRCDILKRIRSESIAQAAQTSVDARAEISVVERRLETFFCIDDDFSSIFVSSSSCMERTELATPEISVRKFFEQS